MCEIVCKTCGGRSLDNFLKRAAATRWGNGAEAVPGASVSLLSPLLRGRGAASRRRVSGRPDPSLPRRGRPVLAAGFLLALRELARAWGARLGGRP